jgi:carbonic anhydrase/acetyltransferase-like protein (isoleucine patch superfamily)
LRTKGVRIGDRVHLYSPWTIRVDIQRPWMIEIGNNVHLTADVSILQHDYSWSVIQNLTGEVLGSAGPVRIGDNVFIGQRTLLLKGTDIGDNSIIGAGSVVAGRLEGGAVYAGIPAKRLMSMEEYVAKRRKNQFSEARALVVRFMKVHGVAPEREHLREFFWLFEPSSADLPRYFQDVNALGANAALSLAAFEKNEPVYSSFEDFVAACIADLEDAD